MSADIFWVALSCFLIGVILGGLLGWAAHQMEGDR